jgi:molybdopterin-binding protein
MAKVELSCGPYRMVSIITREAAEELDLKPGDTATAVVKSTSVEIRR